MKPWVLFPFICFPLMSNNLCSTGSSTPPSHFPFPTPKSYDSSSPSPHPSSSSQQSKLKAISCFSLLYKERWQSLTLRFVSFECLSMIILVDCQCQFIPRKCLPQDLCQGCQRCLSSYLFKHYHLHLLMEVLLFPYSFCCSSGLAFYL